MKKNAILLIELQDLIYSNLSLVIGDTVIDNVFKYDETFQKYQYYKVIGIRAYQKPTLPISHAALYVSIKK